MIFLQGNLPRPFALGDGRVVVIRPMEDADIGLAAAFLCGLGSRTSYMRFMSVGRASARDLEKWIEIDRSRDVALLAETRSQGGRRELADVRCLRDRADSRSAELAVVVADDAQRQGLGGALLCALFAVASSMGIELLHGTTLHDNVPLLGLARKFGFRIQRRAVDDVCLRLELELRPNPCGDAIRQDRRPTPA
jgi:acetyltransferase